MRKMPWLLVVAALSCAGGSKAVRPPPPPDPVAVAVEPPAAVTPAEEPLPLWPLVKQGTLPNGLTYYILPHHEPAHRASLWLAVNAGSLQEDDDQRGLAHLVEHMAFNGTEHFAKQGIVDYLEKIGMEFGPDVNAFTSWDETVYQIQVPTDDASYVTTGLDILRDWAGGVAFDPAEVEKERGVVLEEWRLGAGAFDRLLKKQAAVIWGGTRYAERLPIGEPAIITKAPRDTILRFYRDWYRPDLMAVIVVGDVDPAAIEGAIATRFGSLTNPAAPRPRQGGGELDRSGTKVSIETDPELPRTQVEIQNLFPHRRESHASDYQKFVGDSLYHTMLRARLDQLGRKPDAPFVFAFSSTGDQTREFESFSRGAFAKDGQAEATLAVLLTEVARIERHGFTETELARAKATMLAGTARSAAEWDKADATEFADELTRHFFEHELVIGRVAEDALARTMVPAMTLAEVNQLSRAWGGPDTRAIVISAPADATGLPTRERVLALVKEIEAQPLEPWVEPAPPTALLAQLPTPGTITKETTLDDLGVTAWTLSNGARVLVKPTDFENQTVHFAARSPGGLAYARDQGYPSARMAAEVVATGGVGALSPDRLDAYMAGKQAEVYAWIDEISEGLTGGAATADLETMLQLAYLRMTAPRRDPDAFAAWKLGRVALLQRRDVEPEVVLQDTVQTVMTGQHKRRRPITAADAAAVDLDAALAFYADRFGDASDFTFVLTGNLDLATLRPLVERYLASLPGRRGVEAWKDVGVKPPRGVVDKVVRAGVEPQATVELVFHDDHPWSRDAERDVGVLASVLELRLHEILREDMSGTYGVGVYGYLIRVPVQRRLLVIRFGCAPENAPRLRKAAMAEIARLQRDGVGEDYLAKVREARKRGHELELRRNDYWLDALVDAATMGDDPHDALDLAPELARITSANVRAAARRFASSKRYLAATLLPVK